MLSDYERGIISETVIKFINDLNISKYPINMIDLIKNHYKDKIILCSFPIESEESDVDAITNYNDEYDKYVMVINQNRIKPSLMKRLNFSLAHEIGHIVLKHNEIVKIIDNYDWEKYGSEEDPYSCLIDEYCIDHPTLLEEEANEFAGRLLVDDKLLKKFGMRNQTYLSDYFFVSQSVIKVRFDIMNRRLPIKVCTDSEYKRKIKFEKNYIKSISSLIK